MYLYKISEQNSNISKVTRQCLTKLQKTICQSFLTVKNTLEAITYKNMNNKKKKNMNNKKKHENLHVGKKYIMIMILNTQHYIPNVTT